MKRSLGAIVLTVALVSAADLKPPLDRTVAVVAPAVQPDQAMDRVRRIYETDRWFTFPKFEETARYIAGEMKRLGLDEVETTGAPADGVTQVGYWTMPLAWDVRQARLELADADVPEAFRILADYQKVPTSLGMWSGPTPAGGVTAEIVEYDERADLAGKLVLTGQNPSGLKWRLARRGALGAINTFTENPELEDGRQWINAWGDNGWAFTKGSSPLVCFSITPRQAAFVRQRLSEGKTVRARAAVDSRYYPGVYPYISGALRGDPGTEEVLLLGHTSEQGAQDNATGVAAMLEAMGALHRLVASGALPRPRRSIRMLAMGEMYGSMHYVAAHPDRIRATVAAMCVDTPAASYRLAGTEYTFYLNPHAAKSYTDALVLAVAEAYFPTVRRPWHSHPYMSGTDTFLADPMIGIPTVWPYSGSGVQTHHNSEDTPDDVDPRSLRDLAVVIAAYLYTVASAGETEAGWLAEIALSRGYRQLVEAADRALSRVPGAVGADDLSGLLSRGREAIAYAAEREAQAVRSVERLVPVERRQALVPALEARTARLDALAREQQGRLSAAMDERARHLGLSAPIRPQPDPASGEASRLVVRRKRMGTIPLDEITPDQRRGYPSGAWAAEPIAALYWCDGRRTLAEVIRLVGLELGPTRFDYPGYFRFLAERGYVELIQR